MPVLKEKIHEMDIKVEYDEDTTRVGPFKVRTTQAPTVEDRKLLELCFGKVKEDTMVVGVEDNDAFHVDKKNLCTGLMPEGWISTIFIKCVADMLCVRECKKGVVQRWFFPMTARTYRIYLPKRLRKSPEYIITKQQLQSVKQSKHFYLIVFNTMEHRVEVCDTMKDDIKIYRKAMECLVFFPILAYEHFYVIVFNIRNGYAVILDNLKSDAPYDGKYKKKFEFVKSLLVDFLARNKFRNTNLFLCEKDAKVLNLRWKTRNDKINCGLYAMIHMEHYEFEDEEWEIGILDEEDAQHRIQMDVLRNRYITKILLHEINQHKRKMIYFAENWISENPDEFEEEGTEAKLRRINEEDCLKYNLSPAEIKEEQKFECFKSKLLLEINKMGDFLKGCKYRRNFGYKKIVGVDCVEVDQYPKCYSVTLNDNSKHKLSASELQNFGFQEWNEFMFCIFHGSLNDKMKKKIMTAVLKLLTMAKMMNQISADEAYQNPARTRYDSAILAKTQLEPVV
ncbi:ulp1 protease family, C-terminal catalytic domain-containing protein [Artemisia annua]|uniref:Ulp1 protease family, C-terminal catalytic domain-containing protein n=1 Tax=Artemisia annua TaxID=35608 RepID=A0A2U1LLB2_ARTAN|nr:ulp1 protease family, C-terminal catalytic domain-containing protein [Artemisia annua]